MLRWLRLRTLANLIGELRHELLRDPSLKHGALAPRVSTSAAVLRRRSRSDKVRTRGSNAAPVPRGTFSARTTNLRSAFSAERRALLSGVPDLGA